MQIYSFEFSSKPIKWYLNEFKNMKFIGTESGKFKSNRNFIRLGDNISESDIKFNTGTYYSPAITIDRKLYLKTLDEEDQKVILNDSNRGENNLCIITIDKNCYRLLGYQMGSDGNYDGLSPSLRKYSNAKFMKVALFEFHIPENDESTEYLDLMFYNKILRLYQQYRIYTTENYLRCDNITREVLDDVMDDWKKIDRKSKCTLDEDFE